MSDLISVVIPVYNVEKYLRQAVDSVLNQTYKNLEIILVDDGSPDRCPEICDEYRKQYNKIKVIHKQNAGLGMARNSGIEIATGNYIYFHDSDDYIAEDEIEKLHNAIKKYEVDICITGYTSVDDDGNILNIRKYREEVFEGKRARTEMLPRIIGSSPGKKDSFEMASAGTMYAMSVIRKNGIRFVSERKLKNEDMVFNIDFLQYANGGCAIESTGQFYRHNPLSLSHKFMEDRFERDKEFHYKMKERLQKLEYDQSVIERLQRNFFIHIMLDIRHANNKFNPHSYAEKYRSIRNICNDNLVQETIKEFPCHELGWKQRIFLYLVEHRCTITLMLALR